MLSNSTSGTCKPASYTQQMANLRRLCSACFGQHTTCGKHQCGLSTSLCESRHFGTIYDLEAYLCTLLPVWSKAEDKPPLVNYDVLYMGPITAHPAVIHYFGLKPSTTSVCKVGYIATHVLPRLCMRLVFGHAHLSIALQHVACRLVYSMWLKSPFV